MFHVLDDQSIANPINHPIPKAKLPNSMSQGTQASRFRDLPMGRSTAAWLVINSGLRTGAIEHAMAGASMVPAQSLP